MFLVFDTESECIEAEALLEPVCTRRVRLDGKWFIPEPNDIPEGIPAHTIEEESLAWYSPDTREYNILLHHISKISLNRQQKCREFGKSIVDGVIDKIGERNLVLESKGTPVLIQSFAVDNYNVKLLIETGALENSVYLCSMFSLKYPTHSDIYSYVTELINEFLFENNF